MDDEDFRLTSLPAGVLPEARRAPAAPGAFPPSRRGPAPSAPAVRGEASLPRIPVPAPADPAPLPSVSVVVVTYDSAETIRPCLEALLATTRPRFETIVVDNGSKDGSAELVRRHFPTVRVVEPGRNLGFAGGVLLGTRHAGGEFLVLLNPDTVVRPDWLPNLLDGLASDPRIAVAGSKILEPDGRTLQHVGGIVRANGLTNHVGRGETDRGQYDEPADVPYVTGAALAIRRSAIRRHGFLDPGYFPAYYEELELCTRLRKEGHRIVVFPSAVLVHQEAASSGKGSTKFHFAFHRNRLRFVLKNFGPLELLRFVPAELRWAARSLPAGSGGAYLRAAAFAAAALPATLLRRLLGPPREA